jgi:autotransporter-associated beta strand protein
VENLEVWGRGDTTRSGVAALQASSHGILHHLKPKPLFVALAALLLTTTSALADGGAGGAGVPLALIADPSTAGGAAGGDGAGGGVGGSTLSCAVGGAGGGGGGAGGGLGGNGGSTPAGPGGTSGAAGTSAVPFTCGGGGGGGGGNGGANGQTIAGPLTINSGISGGPGGNGGAGGAGGATNFGIPFGAVFATGAGGGGGGGAGGNAVSVTGASAVTVSSTAVLSGGSGGSGGNAGNQYPSDGALAGGTGGNGGDGGAGIAFIARGGTLLNSGTIQGGPGGMPGQSQANGRGSLGLGGSGVTGADLTIINGGSISAGSGGQLGSRGNAIVFSGGSNVLTMSGGGTLTGNLVIASGLLTLAQSGESWTYGNAITGGGAVAITTAGGSVVALQGVSTYGGGTTVTTGSTLAIDSYQSIGSGVLMLQDGGTLKLTAPGMTLGNAIQVTGITTISASEDALITSAIVDGFSPGGIVKTGPGMLILSGTSSYSGLTQVKSGVLQVDGSIASSSQISVLSGGMLRGTGTVGKTQVESGGTFAPGSTPLTSMTVAGNLGFQPGAIYLVRVNTLGMTSANVSGMAFLGGTVTVAASSGWRQWTVIETILHAGALSGSFDGVSAPAGFTSSLSYSPTDVTLTTVGGFASDLTLSRNHAALVAAHDSYFYNGGAMPARFDAVLALSGSNLTDALTQISGETPTGGQQASFNAMTQFLGTLSDPTLEGRGGAALPAPGFAEEEDARNAYAATGRKRSGSERDAYGMMTKAVPRAPTFEARWSVWGAGFGGSQTTDGNVAQGSNSTTSRISGVAAGADYAFSPQTTAGFALAGGGTNFSVAGGGSGRSDLVQLGGFVRHTLASAYVTAALAYGWQDVTTDRTVAVAGIDRLRGRFNTNAYSARVEAGDRTVLPWAGGIGVTPYAAAQVTTLDLPGYAESTVAGPAAFALSYAAKSVTAPRTEFGLRSDKSFVVGDAVLTLRGRAAWAHDFNVDRSASATFQSLPGASFVVNGARPAHDAALTTASAEMKFVSGISLAATFEGEFSEVTRSYAGKGVARYSW